MPTIRIGVASTPLTRTLDEAVPAAVAAIETAARLGARIVCLPETGLPGHRLQGRPVPDVDQASLDAALAIVADAARRAGIAAIVGTERPVQGGREIVSMVIDADGAQIGEQVKTQVDPTEESEGGYVPGSGRRVFTAAGLTFGIAICHEGFRYPELVRSMVLAGADVIFAPQFVTTEDGTLPTAWRAPSNPYNESALRSRALENTVFVAAANCAAPTQGSITGIIDPDGELLASLSYGEVGVAVADIDTAAATRELALRWAPERSLVR